MLKLYGINRQKNRQTRSIVVRGWESKAAHIEIQRFEKVSFSFLL